MTRRDFQTTGRIEVNGGTRTRESPSNLKVSACARNGSRVRSPHHFHECYPCPEPRPHASNRTIHLYTYPIIRPKLFAVTVFLLSARHWAMRPEVASGAGFVAVAGDFVHCAYASENSPRRNGVTAKIQHQQPAFRRTQSQFHRGERKFERRAIDCAPRLRFFSRPPIKAVRCGPMRVSELLSHANI